MLHGDGDTDTELRNQNPGRMLRDTGRSPTRGPNVSNGARQEAMRTDQLHRVGHVRSVERAKPEYRMPRQHGDTNTNRDATPGRMYRYNGNPAETIGNERPAGNQDRWKLRGPNLQRMVLRIMESKHQRVLYHTGSRPDPNLQPGTRPLSEHTDQAGPGAVPHRGGYTILQQLYRWFLVRLGARDKLKMQRHHVHTDTIKDGQLRGDELRYQDGHRHENHGKLRFTANVHVGKLELMGTQHRQPDVRHIIHTDTIAGGQLREPGQSVTSGDGQQKRKLEQRGLGRMLGKLQQCMPEFTGERHQNTKRDLQQLMRLRGNETLDIGNLQRQRL